MASLAIGNPSWENLFSGNDNPPPYSPDVKDIIKRQDESERDGWPDNIQDPHICGVCHRTCTPSEFVYYCIMCKKINDELVKNREKDQYKRGKRFNEVKGSKKDDKTTKLEVCQNCQARGELCPNGNGEGNHELKQFILRGSVYRLAQSRTVLSSDSNVVKCVKARDAAALNALGKNAAGLNTRDESGNTPLHIAIKLGFEDIVKVLVDMGALVEARNDDGSSPLILALDYHYPAIISTLPDLGADPNGKGTFFTPLHRAAALGNAEIILALLANKPIIDSMYKGVTPLFIACVLNKLATARLLLDAGASPNLFNTTGSSDKIPQHSVFTQMVIMDRPEAARLLIKYGADIEAKQRICKDKSAWETPLTAAAIFNSIGVCRVLLDAGADINAPSSNGKTPLARAAAYGRLDFVRLLLERKPDLQTKSNANWNALADAAHMGHLEIVKILIDHGALGDPSPYRHWKSFQFAKGVPEDTKKAILPLVRSVKHSPKLKSA